MGRPSGNPFSTRYTQPGALKYLFDEGQNASGLVARLRDANWWGQILGPHGAGKTTLLKSLLPLLEGADRRVEVFTLRGGQRRLPCALHDGWSGRDRRVQIVVDGYEQLGRCARWRLLRRCRRTGAGLLVTSHQDAGLPTLVQARPSLQVLTALVHQLQAGQRLQIEERAIAQCYQRCQGDVRESLFALYDLYEMRQRDEDPVEG